MTHENRPDRDCKTCNNTFENKQKRSFTECEICRVLSKTKRRKDREQKKKGEKKVYDRPDKKCKDCDKVFENNLKKAHTRCRDCRKIYLKTYYQSNCEKAKLANRENWKLIKGQTKDTNQQYTCRKCNVEKSGEFFRANRVICNDCNKKYGREYNKENKHIRDKWLSENQDRMTELQAHWFQNNKEHINMKLSERYKTDIQYKLRSSNSSKYIRMIKTLDTCPEKMFLGTKYKQILKWFNYMFSIRDDSFTIQDHGAKWEVDHIIPVKMWDLTDITQKKLCYDWKNMMPCTRKENRLKSDNIDLKVIKSHRDNLYTFCRDNRMKIDKLEEYLERCDEYILKYLENEKQRIMEKTTLIISSVGNREREKCATP